MTIFLGGTCNDSNWRELLKPMLELDYFDPTVDIWHEEAYQKELKARSECHFILYVIMPKTEGYYSIAELVEDANQKPRQSLFCILEEDGDRQFSAFQKQSLHAMKLLAEKRGARYFDSLEEIANFLNSSY